MTDTRDDNERRQDGDPVSAPGEAVDPEALGALPAPRPLGECLADAFDLIGDRVAGKRAPVPVPFKPWGEALRGGLYPGVHFFVGGTKVGKSTLLSQVALHAAMKGHPVSIAPLEIGREQAVVRLLGDAARVHWADLYTGSMSADEWAKGEIRERVNEARAELAKLPITIDGASPNGWPASRIEALAEAAKAGQEDDRTPLVMVDFTQILGPEENEGRSDIRERIRAAAYRAQGIAESHGVAVVLVSSVARSHYGIVSGNPKKWKEAGARLIADTARDKGTVHVNELRIGGIDALIGLGKESGELEYSASSITVMVRTRNPDGSPGNRTALLVPANRLGGATAWTPIVFDNGRFTEGDDADALAIVESLAGEAAGVDTRGITESMDGPSGKPKSRKKKHRKTEEEEDFG